MKKIAIYCRVSTQDQSLDQQRIPLIEYCKRRGWMYEVFEGKISGAKASRTELDILMKGVSIHKFNKYKQESEEAFAFETIGKTVDFFIENWQNMLNRYNKKWK